MLQVLSTLDPRTAAVLERLYAESDSRPEPVPPKDLAEYPRPVELTEEQVRAFDDEFLTLEKEQAAYCYTQARATGARTIVEFGTSFGISTIWLAAAVRDNGGGTVISAERVPRKAERARAHIAEAGLEQYVEIRVGDARETLRALDGPVDMFLNDGFPDVALEVHRLVTPALRPGALVITDNVGLMPDLYADYLAWIRDPAHGFVSVRIPFHGGTEFSVLTEAVPA